MGKDLRGKQLGTGISQRKDGLYTARFTTKMGKRVQKYSKNLQECCDWLTEAKNLDKYEAEAAKSTSNKNELPLNQNRKSECTFVQYSKEKNEVPIWEKFNLTIEEAAIYFNIGICKLKELSRQPNCPFVLHVGRRKLIKRQQFEEFIRMAKLLYNN